MIAKAMEVVPDLVILVISQPMKSAVRQILVAENTLPVELTMEDLARSGKRPGLF